MTRNKIEKKKVKKMIKNKKITIKIIRTRLNIILKLNSFTHPTLNLMLSFKIKKINY